MMSDLLEKMYRMIKHLVQFSAMGSDRGIASTRPQFDRDGQPAIFRADLSPWNTPAIRGFLTSFGGSRAAWVVSIEQTVGDAVKLVMWGR